MQVISSKENEMVKMIKKLKDKKQRDLSQEFMIEGIKMIKEAIAEKAKIKKIVICDDCIENDGIEKEMLYEVAKYDCIYVTKQVFQTMTEVSTPQGILAVIEKQNQESQIDYTQDCMILLDGIQDPGNLGTIIRTVDSCDLKQVIVSKQTADAFNPKVVRSTMGAIFRVKVIEVEDLVKTAKEMQKHHFEIVATCLETKQSIYDINYTKKAMVIGNEANGVSKELLELADQKVKIPMLGKTESLNASVAAGVILYEAVRQKLANN